MSTPLFNSQKRLKTNRKAFALKDVEALKKGHSLPFKNTHKHESHLESGVYLGDGVYGALDGIVTTFAIISGVIGAGLSPQIILVLGFSNLIADGLSMAAGNYLSVKSTQDFAEQERAREEWEIEHYPAGEKEEIKEIYSKKGFKGEILEAIVEGITADKKVWVDTMMREELGIQSEQKNPLISALVTFLAFLFCGFLPLFIFVLIVFFPQLHEYGFILSCSITALSIFIVGSLRSLLISKKWFYAGLEMLLVGGSAATIAYSIGYFLRDYQAMIP